MWKSIFYKEWLKIRLVYALSLFASIAAVFIIYSTVRHDLLVIPANEYVRRMLYEGLVYYSLIKFFPAAIGIIIGLAQFVPEVTEKRIKLTLHLPLNEEKAGLKMICFGIISLISLFGLQFLLLTLIGGYYFPEEVIRMMSLTLLIWFFSGFAAYFFVALITIEPLWKYRMFYIVIGGLFLNMFFLQTRAGSYRLVILYMLGLVLLSSISILYSLYRYRKGEM